MVISWIASPLEMAGKARRAACTSPARVVPDWTLRQAPCPKDATWASVTPRPKVRTFRTSETNCSWGALNVGVADEATAVVGVAGADEAGGRGALAPPPAAGPGPQGA